MYNNNKIYIICVVITSCNAKYFVEIEYKLSIYEKIH